MLKWLKFSKTFSFERGTVSCQLSTVPAFLSSAHMVAAAGGAATACLYDGHGTIGTAKVDLAAPASSADDRTFNPPILFHQGIYLSTGSNVTSVFVMFRHIKDFKPEPTNGGPKEQVIKAIPILEPIPFQKSETLLTKIRSWLQYGK